MSSASMPALQLLQLVFQLPVQCTGLYILPQLPVHTAMLLLLWFHDVHSHTATGFFMCHNYPYMPKRTRPNRKLTEPANSSSAQMLVQTLPPVNLSSKTSHFNGCCRPVLLSKLSVCVCVCVCVCVGMYQIDKDLRLLQQNFIFMLINQTRPLTAIELIFHFIPNPP